MDAMPTKGEQLVKGVVNHYEEGEYIVEARVGTDMVVRPCSCRLLWGGIAQCAQCQAEKEAM